MASRVSAGRWALRTSQEHPLGVVDVLLDVIDQEGPELSARAEQEWQRPRCLQELSRALDSQLKTIRRLSKEEAGCA